MWNEVVIQESIDLECNQPVSEIKIECYDEYGLFISQNEIDEDTNIVNVTYEQAKELYAVLGTFLKGKLHLT
jgi:hypothetical protein